MKSSKDEFLPSQLLIEKNRIKEVSKQFIDSNKWFSGFTFSLGLFIPVLITFLSNIVSPQSVTASNAVLQGFAIALFVACSILGIVSFQTRNKRTLYNAVCENVLEESDYTFVFVIAKTNNSTSAEIELLSTLPASPNDRIFLPYIKVDPMKSLEDNMQGVKAKLATETGLNIRENQILNITPINDIAIPSVKLLYHRSYKQIRYEFFSVSLKKELMNRPFSNFEWRSLEELSNNPQSMIYNYDVIEYLKHSQQYISDSFRPDLDRNTWKIIWNITKKCNYDCGICGTDDPNRAELDLGQKSSILLKIINSGLTITTLDFAGGDPLVDGDSREIIDHAIKSLGSDVVSITTTNKGISCLSEKEKNEFLRQCELTIDASDFDEIDSLRAEEAYSTENFGEININKRYFKNLHINIPILKTDIDTDFAKRLSEKIREIDVPNKSITLLRLMPVGKMNKRNYPVDYAPFEATRILRDELSKVVDVHIHCALRGKINNEKSNCTMATRKIGIDCAGNVYACAWAAYLDTNGKENPFFIGNLLQKDLKTMLSENHVEKIYNRLQGNNGHCCIFSYLYSADNHNGERKMFAQYDPLFQKEVNK